MRGKKNGWQKGSESDMEVDSLPQAPLFAVYMLPPQMPVSWGIVDDLGSIFAPSLGTRRKSGTWMDPCVQKKLSDFT